MTGRHESGATPSDRQELEAMREDELLDFIRDTVRQLNKLGDRLETYARDKNKGEQ